MIYFLTQLGKIEMWEALFFHAKDVYIIWIILCLETKTLFSNNVMSFIPQCTCVSYEINIVLMLYGSSACI